MTAFMAESLKDPETRRTFEEEYLYGEATDTVAALLESLGLSQKELAQRLGVSKGRVSQILSGEENLTLRSLAALGWALGVRFELNPQPMQDRGGTPAEGDPSPPEWLSQLPRRPQVVKRPFKARGCVPRAHWGRERFRVRSRTGEMQQTAA